MKISGIGCCLIDHVYQNFRYNTPAFQNLLSKIPGDGGIIQGGLVFAEDLEVYAKKPFNTLLVDLVGSAPPDFSNLGGPSVVALVHASQMLAQQHVEVHFYGALGDDQQSLQIEKFLSKTPIVHHVIKIGNKSTPSTIVLADPTALGGKGERSFINTIGAANNFSLEDIPDSFFQSEIVLMGGTALVPKLHDQLEIVLAKAKKSGCLTVVGTVYDFRAQKSNPNEIWPIGGKDAYKFIDLLIADAEEALRLSGGKNLEEAAQILISFGVGALIITHGSKDILVWSSGRIFSSVPLSKLPVSAYIDDLLEEKPDLRKDTTGCGDNFVGGVITSLSLQKQKLDFQSSSLLFDLIDACAWGASSGGFTCMYHGGTYYEKDLGEKREKIEPIIKEYRKQIGLI